MIYLDNAATTQVYDKAIEEIVKVLSDEYFNPSATYSLGLKSKNKITQAKQTISNRLNCQPKEIIFTSCATESNNWVISHALRNKKFNIVISAGEHASVYECAKAYKSKGFDVRIAPLQANGTVDVEKLISLIDENTSLVSIIHASNETGVINNLSTISKTIKSKYPKILLHSDGVQAFGKIDNNVKNLGVDFYSISGHKIGAPKGIGALYVSSKITIQPFIYGGGQENGMRSGTENTSGISALATALDEFVHLTKKNNPIAVFNCLESQLAEIEGVKIVSQDAPRTNFICCFTVTGIKAEIIQTMCADSGVIIGRGSACSSKHSGNRVLSEMGIPQKEIDGALRLSINPSTTIDEITSAVSVLKESITKLRGHKIG